MATDAPKTKLPQFQSLEMLILTRSFVGLCRRLAVVTGSFGVATYFDVSFAKGWGTMKFVRSLSTLVLVAGVSFTLGCTGSETTTSGGSSMESGSGVAGGAEAPHSHDGEDGHAHEAAEMKTETPAEAPAEAPAETPAGTPAEAPAEETPAAEAPKAADAPSAEAPAEEAPKAE